VYAERARHGQGRRKRTQNVVHVESGHNRKQCLPQIKRLIYQHAPNVIPIIFSKFASSPAHPYALQKYAK
jgi:hypothetical protein